MYATASKQKLCNNQIRIQNKCYQFTYEQLHISAKTTEKKLIEILITNDI